VAKKKREKLTTKLGMNSQNRGARKSFIALGEEEERLLKELRPMMEQESARLAKGHYDHVQAYPEPYSLLTGRRDREGLEKGQADYFVSLCDGVYDEGYFESRLRIGGAYARMGMKPKWYIGAYGYYAHLIFPWLYKKFRFRPHKLMKSALAISTVLNLDLQLAMKMYMEGIMDQLRGLADKVGSQAMQIADAVGRLSKMYTQMDERARHVSEAIEQVTEGVTRQREGVSVASERVRDLSGDIGDIGRGAKTQVDVVEETARIVEDMSRAIAQVADGAQKAADAGARTGGQAEAGLQAVQKSVHGMEAIRGASAEVNSRVDEMGERAQQIGAIVEVIEDIAGQTNLLALNAAIEAARAGEHGRGFAVVAEEVRKLAERSAASTKEIAELISGVQQSVGQALNAREEVEHQVEAGTTLVQDAGKALEDILTAVHGVNEQVQTSAAAAQEMQAQSDLLRQSMERVSQVAEVTQEAAGRMAEASDEVQQAMEGIAAVSEENSAIAEEVYAATEEMLRDVGQAAEEVQGIAAMGQGMQDAIAQLRAGDEQVSSEATAIVPRRRKTDWAGGPERRARGAER